MGGGGGGHLLFLIETRALICLISSLGYLESMVDMCLIKI